MNRLIIADANRVSMSDFITAMRPVERKQDESSLMGKLYMAIRDKDAEAEAAARAQLDAMRGDVGLVPVTRDIDPQTGNERAAA